MRKLVGCAAIVAAAWASHGAGRALAQGPLHWTVPGDFPSIQTAIDAAPRDARVEIDVLPGTYVENVMISGFQDLHLVAPGRARIESLGTEPAVSMCRSQVVEIQGFDIASHAAGVQIFDTLSASLGDLDIESPATYGVLAEGAARAPVTHAHFHYGHYEGEDLARAQTNVTVSGTTIANAGADAIRVGVHAELTLRYSTIVAPHDDGVRVIGGENSGIAVVSGTSISDAGGDGIEVSDTAVQIASAAIYGAAGHGIVLSGTAAGAVSGATIHDVGGDGIATSGAARFDAVTSNAVYATGGSGIRVVSPLVNLNTVKDTQGDGIWVISGASQVLGNEVMRTGGDGICLTGGSRARNSTVLDNIVTSPAGDGIDVRSSSGVRLTMNSVADAGDCGFRLDAGSSHNLLKGNTATDSMSWDLWDGARPGRNAIGKSNAFKRKHRRHKQ